MGNEWPVKRIVFTRHAMTQMFARSILIEEVKNVIADHEILVEYSDDQPCPSRLLLGFNGQKPMHVVLGYDSTIETGFVITAYIPDITQWEPDFKMRKTK